MEKTEESTVKVMRDDEDTLGIFHEYTQKFVEAIQQEKERVRKQALKESDNIIAEAVKKAQKTYEKAKKDAETKSDWILAESRELAKLIISEAERFAKAVTELTEKVEQEIEEARGNIRQEAEVIAEAIRKGEKSISEAKDKLQNEFRESSRVVTELRQKLEQATEAAKSETEKEIAHLDELVESSQAITNEREEVVERAGIEAHDDSLEGCNDKSFFGTVYLDMYSGGPALSERFQHSLSKIPNLEVSLVDKPTDEKTRITIFIGKPIPLLGILNQMQLVESVVRDKESIRVVLKNGNLWRGQRS